MPTTVSPSTLRKHGSDEGAYRPPDPGKEPESPLQRRRGLLRRLRSDPSIGSHEMRLLESSLDRVAVSDPSHVVFDSVRSFGKRTGLSDRVVDFTLSSLRDKGKILRLYPRQFREWLDRIGTIQGYAYPANAGRPCKFTVLLVGLAPEVADRARMVASAIVGDRAEIDASNTLRSAHPIAQIFAPALPIGNSSSTESGSLNREEDEKLEKGGGENPEKSDPGEAPLDRRAWLEVLPVDDPLRDRILGIVSPPDLIGKAPGVAVDRRPDSPRQLVELLGEPPSERPSSQPGPARVSTLVRDLPGAPTYQLDRVTRALLRHFRDEGNPITEQTFRKYLDLVRMKQFPADLVVGLVDDADRPSVRKPARVLSMSLAEEYRRVKNRSPG